MRNALRDLLYRRYPDLYVRASSTDSSSCMSRGFTCCDGWFALIDALSETVSSFDPVCQALQVKEKFGALKFYRTSRNETLDLAIMVAEQYSLRVCEVTGEPGDLTRTTAGWWRTISQTGLRQCNTEAKDADTEDKISAERRRWWTKDHVESHLRNRHNHALLPSCQIDIPRGGFDLVDAFLQAVSPHYESNDYHFGRPPITVLSLKWRVDSDLVIEIDDRSLIEFTKHEIDRMATSPKVRQVLGFDEFVCQLRLSIAVACQFARNMSRRIDYPLGQIGPVDDEGRLIQ